MKLPQSLTTVTTFSKLLALFLFITLPFAGFYLGTKYEQSISPQTQQYNTAPIAKPTLDPTADWKTYASLAGYSIKYPQNLTSEEQAAGVFAFLRNSKDHENFDFYIDERQGKIITDTRFIEKTYQSGNKTIKINCKKDFCESITFDLILSTFKFTDSVGQQGSNSQKCAQYTQNGVATTICATCGNGTCEPYETCTSSSSNNMAATSDCGQLYCPKDCK